MTQVSAACVPQVIFILQCLLAAILPIRKLCETPVSFFYLPPMSSASKFVNFGTSLFLRTTNNGHPHKTISFKPLPSLQFHLYCSSSTAATATATATTDDDIMETLNSLQQENKQKQHPWPEWVTFVDKLKTRGYFMETSEDENIIAYTDMNQLRDGCLSFARDRYDVLKSLSIPDIQTVVESGCPNILRKVVNSAKRMRAYVQKDEGDACSACIHRGCCDRAYVILKSNEAEGRTIDIVRVLMFHALDPLVISEGEKSPGSELIEASARKLLSELVELSETPHDPALPKRTPKTPDKKERVVNFTGGILRENVEMKKGDWICTKCNFMNFTKNKRCRKCGEQSAKKDGDDSIEVKKGDWICSECNFMNFAKNKRCRKCGEQSSKKDGVDSFEVKKGDWICSECNFMNFAKNKRCRKCGEQSAKKDGDDSIEVKKGDWICSECEFLNFSRNIKCLKCKADGPERVAVDNVEMKRGDWNCTKCGFMNFASNKTCLRCLDPRPERDTGEWNCPSCDFLNFTKNKVCLKCNCDRPKRMGGEWHCPSCDFMNFSRNAVCLKCDCKRPREAMTEYEEQIWKSPY
uniref:RanBP2-type domain-containing protein n=1 Tax=Populus trichocarpa TaxID=3694 RepID=A0A2K1Y8Y5_POPTR